jgi:hypothetical protein
MISFKSQFMKKKQICFKHTAIFSLLVTVIHYSTWAQQSNCTFQKQVVNIDFGNTDIENVFYFTHLKNYEKTLKSCPDDGYFSFSSFVGDCFEGKWHNLAEDHTAGDLNGKMMIVNASFSPGPFFVYKVTGLKPGAEYEFSAWIVNICKSADGCIPTPPVISFSFQSASRQIARIKTAPLTTRGNPVWLKQSGRFTLPSDLNEIVIYFEDLTRGGCGNDFALDDIVMKECNKDETPLLKTASPQPETSKLARSKTPKTIEKNKPKKELVEELKPSSTKKPPMPKSEPPAGIAKNNSLDEQPLVKALPPVAKVQELNQKTTTIPKPGVIETRSNPVLKQIETVETEMTIQLYDNGQIDGDTVSIYHNNVQIVDRAGLSATPVTAKIKVDKQHPHHELVMVAENLGSIPPNTSVMIITTKNNRYEIFITATEQKNAKIVIDLVEK